MLSQLPENGNNVVSQQHSQAAIRIKIKSPL
jgi:hypothetical protein